MDDMSPAEMQAFVQALPQQVRRALAAQIARARQDGMLRAAKIATAKGEAYREHTDAGSMYVRITCEVVAEEIRAAAKVPA